MLTTTGTAHQRRAVAAVVTLLLTAGAVLVAPTPAVAQGAVCPPGQTNCDIHDPGGPGDPGDPGDGGDPGDSGGGGTYHPDLGWLSSDGCYYKVAEPQPDGVPDGQIAYTQSCPGPPPTAQNVFLDAPPDGFTPPDPETVARDLFATIDRLHPTIHLAPSDGPGLVGLPVWLWTDQSESAQQRTWGQLYDDDTEQGVYVEIWANVVKIVYQMNDGRPPVECVKERQGAYGPGVDPHKEPPCGSPGYLQPGEYEITATAHWRVDWESGNQRDFFMDTQLTATATIEIDELQVVTE